MPQQHRPGKQLSTLRLLSLDIDLPNVEQGKEAEDEEAPFVGGGDQSADEAGDDDHPGEEGGGENLGEGEARGEQQ